MHSKLVLLTFLDAGPVDPGFGGGLPAYGGGYPSGGPVYPPGHPSAGLPISPGHPSGGFPISPGHPSGGFPISPGHPANRPPGIPPNVVWPPQGGGGGGSTLPAPPPEIGNALPPAVSVPEGSPLPPDTVLILVYSEKSGWVGSTVGLAQPK